MKIRQFQRVQDASGTVRSLTGDLSEREAALRRLELEKRARANPFSDLQLFLKRVLTI